MGEGCNVRKLTKKGFVEKVALWQKGGREQAMCGGKDFQAEATMSVTSKEDCMSKGQWSMGR